MTRALIIGASGGIGQAVSAALQNQGAEVIGLSRSGDGLDVTDHPSVQRVLGQVDGPVDLMIYAAGVLAPPGGPPEKSLEAVTPQAMADTYAVNAIGPALVLAQAKRLLPRDRRAVAAVLTARVGSIGDNQIGGWHSYRASKAAANQIVRGAAIELGRSHKQSIIVALHPGTVETPFTANYTGRHKTMPAAEAADHLLRVLSGLQRDDTGQFFDWQGARVEW